MPVLSRIHPVKQVLFLFILYKIWYILNHCAHNPAKEAAALKIEIIDEKTIKILLSVEDMQEFHLTYEQMDYNDTVTRKAILSIVQKIRQDTTVDLEMNKLFIEAFPDTSGGCILYVNLIEAQQMQSLKSGKQSFDTPLIFILENIDLVAGVSSRLMKEHSHLIIHSSLYQMEQRYYLLLYTYCRMEKKIICLLKEYGSYLGKGAILSAFVHEHGKEILKDNAIETITQYLG